MNPTSVITRGTWVCVTLRDDCQGERPHKPDEDGMRGTVTGSDEAGDHPLFVLFSGRKRESRFPSAPDRFGLDRLPLGRLYRPDELEVISPPA